MSTPALAGLPPPGYLIYVDLECIATLPRFGEIRKASSPSPRRLLPRLAVPLFPVLAGATLQSRPGTSAARSPQPCLNNVEEVAMGSAFGGKKQ
jgi:hypothetical protein